MNNLDAFVSGMYRDVLSPDDVRAGFADFDAICAEDPEFEEAVKHAYISDFADYLKQFEGTALHEAAVDLCTRGLDLEAQRLARQQQRDAQFEALNSARSQLDLEKDKLLLELQRLRARGAAPNAPAASAPVAVGDGITEKSSVLLRLKAAAAAGALRHAAGDLFAAAKGPSPFSGLAKSAPKKFRALPPPVPGSYGTMERHIMASNHGVSAEQAKKLSPMMAKHMGFKGAALVAELAGVLRGTARYAR